MNAICLHRRGGAEAIEYGEVEAPRVPGVGEVLVAVRAAGVTPTELLWAPTWTSKGGGPRSFPVVPGHEFSGVVRSVGSGVSDFAPGDEVYGMNDWFGDGAQAQFCLARAADVARKPRLVDHAAASVTPISALTAWQGLIERAKLAAGGRVLIHGAAGAVGAFAVQLARWRGARVIGTASAHNVAYVRELGADDAIDYRATRFEEVVRDVDVVFDTVGGDTLTRSWGVVRPGGGAVVTIAAGAEQTADPRVREAFFVVEPNRRQLERVTSLIDSGALRPEVGGTFALAEGRRAYETKPARGKVAVVVWP